MVLAVMLDLVIQEMLEIPALLELVVPEEMEVAEETEQGPELQAPATLVGGVRRGGTLVVEEPGEMERLQEDLVVFRQTSQPALVTAVVAVAADLVPQEAPQQQEVPDPPELQIQEVQEVQELLQHLPE